MPIFSYDIGYYGYASISNKYILTTDGNISVEQTPIYTQGIWGSGWYNGSKNVCFAPDYPILSIQLGFQLTNHELFSQLGKFSSSERNKTKKVSVFPNGIAGYSGDVYCQGISFETSQNSLVTGSIQCKGNAGAQNQFVNFDGIENNNNEIGHVEAISNCSLTYRSVYPWYGTKIEFETTGKKINSQLSINSVSKILSWSINSSTQIVFAKCCTGFDKDLSDLYSDYVSIGLMNADGNFSIFGSNTLLQPEQLRTFIKGATISMKPISGIDAKIKMSSLQLTQSQIDMQTGAGNIQTSFNFTVIGDGKKPVLQFE